MPSPLIALSWFAAVCVAGIAFFWPKNGIAARWKRWKTTSRRVQIEDTLKHLLNNELAGQSASLESVAGILGVHRAKAHELMTLLTETGLVITDHSGFSLSDDGRNYALRILRSHRLLEHFFADRTGALASDWHDLAEEAEHTLSENEIELLSMHMGHPMYDPHGDPIPTSSGVLPPDEGVPLTSLIEGEMGVVKHVEDEPASSYEILTSYGIDVSVPLKVVKSDPSFLEVNVMGEIRKLTPLLATAISVSRISSEQDHPEPDWERLDSLSLGESAIVTGIAPSLRGPQRRRLLDLGLLPGTTISAELSSPSGDPVAYDIRGALIALRKPQAQSIWIRRKAQKGEAA